jgi:hypothetical protein
VREVGEVHATHHDDSNAGDLRAMLPHDLDYFAH